MSIQKKKKDDEPKTEVGATKATPKVTVDDTQKTEVPAPAAAKEPARTPEDQGNVVMQKEAFDALMSRLDNLEKKDMSSSGFSAEDIAKIVSAAQAPKEINNEDMVFVAEIDPDDEIPFLEAIQFFAPTAGYVIVDDIRANRIVKPPIKKSIWFDYAGEERVETRMGTTLNVYSNYVSKSKLEVEWLRNHRFYNILFFEDMAKALDMDYRILKILHSAMSAVEAMDPGSIRQRLKEANLPISKNHEMNKKELAFHEARAQRSDLVSRQKSMRMYQGEDRELSDEDLLGLEPLLNRAKPLK